MTTDRVDLFDPEEDHDDDWSFEARLRMWRLARARRRAERRVVLAAWLAAHGRG